MSLYSGLGGGRGPSAHSDVLTADPDTPPSRLALVEEIKRRGRACVASGNYPDADALYGKGIEVLSSALDGEGSAAANGDDEGSETRSRDAAILRSNRSLVRLQMGKVAEALEDADAAARSDPTYVKAHWRRGQACVACGDAGGALESYRRALELEPSNKALGKEVREAEERVEREARMLAEAAEAAEAAVAAGDADDGAVATKVATKVVPVTKVTGKVDAKGDGKPAAPRQSSSPTTTTTETDDSVFSKSDHVRGYKIRSDGKKTSYFNREISDDAKKLIGDIAPKKLDPSSSGKGGGSAVGGASAWNKAGTWEERDVTRWAKETLTASLLSAEYVLPDGSPSPGARAVVSAVSKVDGSASYATVRGKKRHMHEFALTIKWELALDDKVGRTCRGEMTFPDVDGSVELGEGYDVVKYDVDGSSPPGTGPVLDRFVRNGGLRDSVHKAIDDWVRLFRATY